MPLLDKHATLYANQEKPPPDTFHAAFASFVTAFKASNFQTNYLEEDNEVARRHRQFLESCRY